MVVEFMSTVNNRSVNIHNEKLRCAALVQNFCEATIYPSSQQISIQIKEWKCLGNFTILSPVKEPALVP